MSRGPGQPAHLWTKERRAQHSKAMERAWAKKARNKPNGDAVEQRQEMSLREQLKRDPKRRRELDLAFVIGDLEVTMRANDLAWFFYRRLQAEDARIVALLRDAGIDDLTEMSAVMSAVLSITSAAAEKAKPRLEAAAIELCDIEDGK